MSDLDIIEELNSIGIIFEAYTNYTFFIEAENDIAYCIDNTNIIGLRIINRNIDNLILLKIFELRELLFLDLTGINLNKIPKEISNLINLDYLILDNNHIKDVPNEILYLNEMTFLSLENNNIEKISKQIIQLTNLITLILSKNNISTIPNYLLYSEGLEEIDLTDNPIDELKGIIIKLKKEYQNIKYYKSSLVSIKNKNYKYSIGFWENGDIDFALFTKKKLDYHTKQSENIRKEKEIFENIHMSYMENQTPLIITEGKTDWKHLKKALERFQEEGFYQNFNIEFEEYEDTDMGDAELDRMVQTYCKTKQPRKHIFMFDRDNNKYVNAYAKKEFNNHKNNVYSFCIPKISDELDRICIEFYYKKQDLITKDRDGKRIFIGEDFLVNGNSKCGQYVTAQRNAKELDILDRDKKVYLRDDIEWKDNIALSKNDFTNNIITDVEEFNNFDIEHFKLIFDVIEKIVKETI